MQTIILPKELQKVLSRIASQQTEAVFSADGQKETFVILTESRYKEIHAITDAAYEFGKSIEPVKDILQFVIDNTRGRLTPEGVNFHCPHCDTDYFVKNNKIKSDHHPEK